jgi:hypothetical protein
VRPFLSGTITFGLASIPVDLVAAIASRHKSMKLVDEEGHPLGRHYWGPHGREDSGQRRARSRLPDRVRKGDSVEGEHPEPLK